MSEQSTQASPRARLTRSRADRKVAGVCGGLGEFTGLDPVIFRVVFAVAALMGGAGFVAYLVAWVVIPEADSGESILGDRDWSRVGVAVAALVLCLIVTGSIGPWRDNWGGGGLGLIALVALGVWIWTRDEQPKAPPRVPPTPTAATIPDDATSETTMTATVPPPAPPTPPGLPGLPLPPPPPLPPLPHEWRRRQRSKLTGLTLSLALVVGGFLALLDVTDAADIPTYAVFASALIVVGAGLVVGSMYGRRRGLITVGILLTAATAATAVVDVPLDAGAGERRWAPIAVASEAQYALGIGDADLDLSNLDLDGETRRIEVSLGAGDLQVILPPDATTVIDAHAGLGEMTILGSHEEGFDVDRRVVVDGTDGRLLLEIDLGLGSVEVTR